ncbi:hypothetical protein DUNSADRAFT_6176 [Dunaliella salina]|uniref:EF-hand domain-containing protein n=1 Tax=Dunaliella salina TaxID=3046 RepID=A0ABQ7GNY0_DUNSA|nr:hypothetical protein DUNSADRAFT_6176 [Dunaliella salina]|eukprot:KAF5836299.1 hypothetical protein DUNSADRAFT_6176 [Dunaliella salina]
MIRSGMSTGELPKTLSGGEKHEEAELDLPAHTKKDLAAVDSALSTSIHLWLRRRRKNVRPKLSAEQQHQLKECDQDGSGAIDADELGAAFKLLGIGLRKAEIEEILAEVGMNADGEVEYPQFLEIMTVTLQKIAEEQAEDNANKSRSSQDAAMRDAATARKADTVKQDTQEQQRKMLSGLAKRSLARLARMHVDEGLLLQLGPEERRLLNQVAHQTQRQHPHPPQKSTSAGHVPHIKQQQQQQQQPQHRSLSPSLASSRPSPRPWPKGLAMGGGPMAGRGASFPGTERLPHAVGAAEPRQMAVTADGSAQPPQGLGLPQLSKGRASGGTIPGLSHFTQQPRHQQLVGVPQCFDIRFTRPTVHGSGSSTSRSKTAGLPFPTATRPQV